jgi:cyclophilin family peptidyl-prolyl cis-trans isomerase
MGARRWAVVRPRPNSDNRRFMRRLRVRSHRHAIVLALLASAAFAATAPAFARAATAPVRAGARPASAPAESVWVLETAVGTIAVQLFPADAPKTVANVKRLADTGFYDGLTFHRVAPAFVVQGGDPNSRDENPFNDGQGGPGYTLPAEIHRQHTRGAVAMARRGDEENPARESNGSQFYIALRDLPQLDGAYTVFGQVLAGWDTVERLVELAKLTDIARQGNNANPGTHALIRRTRLEPIARWRTRARAAATAAAPDTTSR